jgi:hypothetical protein
MTMMHNFGFPVLAMLLIGVGAASQTAEQRTPTALADWPPMLDLDNTTTRSLDGRIIERFTHGAREAWGYPASARGEWGYWNNRLSLAFET